ncbi:hypothetical protein P3G55_16885 [Leptospira sp. 96542]|nr:hypothetical protein [Leptospira sp. 96542]
MSRCKNFINFFYYAIILSFIVIPVYAKEISILPAQLSGDVPEFLGTKREASFELAKLTKHYLKRNFFAEVSDSKLIESYLKDTNWAEDSEITEEMMFRLCMELDSHFLSQDQIDFGSPILVKTNLFNCRSKSLQTIQSKLISNFLVSYEKHNDKSFRFLTPRFYEKKNKQGQNHEIIYIFDIHSSYAYYKKEFIKAIQSLYNQDGLYLGLTMIRKDKIQSIPPSVDHNDFKRSFEETAWHGTNKAETVLSALQALRSRVSPGKKDSRKIFLLLSSVVKEKSGQFILTINELRQLGYEIVLLVPNHSDLNTIREIQRIGRSSNVRVVGITEYQKIGTPDGYEFIYLNQFQLYSSFDEQIQPFQWTVDSFKRFDASIVRAAVDVVTPYNMHQAYEKITEKRVLEKDEVKTDIESILSLETRNDQSSRDRYQTVLLESKGEAIWIKLPYDLNVEQGKQYTVQSTFMIDPLSTWGVKNIPAETILLKPNVSFPKLLLVKPSQTKRFLETNKIREFNCYMQGTISVIKKR